jgi:hypothetical protein
VYSDETETMDTEDDDFPVLLQVNMHAFSECLSMFQLTATAGGQSAFGGVRSNAFVPIRGSVRLVCEGDGEPFLVMYPP